MDRSAFFRPPHGWVGDVIPWKHGDELRLYYLHEMRTDPKPGTPWHLVTTRDGVEFIDEGEAFAAGAHDAEDFNAYTGSIVEGPDGTQHLFYTGQNPRRLGADGRALQVVCHATSNDDGATWDRHPEHTFGASGGYESGDWRDPFVFYDEEARLWRMLLAARHTDGPERRRGVIAQCVSQDLITWEPAAPFWDPRRYVTHECPEVFRIGDWWYLVYSEFSDAFITRYRMSRTLDGPWLAPELDSLDGRAYYAAKSVDHYGRRLFFGWIATRAGSTDAGAWQWAGTMSVLEAVQRADGTLDFRLLPELLETFSDAQPATWQAADARAGSAGTTHRISAPDSYDAIVTEGVLPDQCRISATIDIEPDTVECGLLLRASADGDTGYALRLEPRRGRVVFDRWPREPLGGEQWEISGDVPFVLELERPLPLDPGLHTIDVVLDGDILVATVDGRVTLSTRIYDHPAGHAGFFVGEGAATITDLSVTTRPRGEVTTASATALEGALHARR